MVRKVTEYAAQRNMLEKNDKVIAGVSGGADSVCLLFMLMEMRKQAGFEIVVVHVNHGLRGENAQRDERHVKELCEKYSIPCEIYREDVELIAKNRKQSLEEAGRNVRREAFQRALVKYGATKIALAHHKNDNVETLIMNLARGTGLKGIGGMKPVNGNVIRPLLCLDRQEIESYLEREGIAYCMDETNASDDYTRNRIRNQIIPLLIGGVNEKAVSHMADAMEMLQEIWEYMEREMQRYYKETVCSQGNGLLISEKAYNNVPKVFRGNVLKEAVRRAAWKERNIHRAHIDSLKELMTKQTGRQISLPYHLTAKRCYEGIFISDGEQEKKVQSYGRIDLQTGSVIKAGDFKISCRILEEGECKKEKSYTKCFDYDIMKNNVVFRTRAPGDYITIDGDGRRQKLKSYFINAKIPSEERDKIWLLAEGSHILWIIGYRRGCAYHVGTDTKKIVEVTINKGEGSDGRDN